MRYRDLPVIPFTPRPYTQITIPAPAKFSDLSISPAGQMYWSYFEQGKGSTIIDENGQTPNLHPDKREKFFFPNVQRFPDGRWLVVESRTDCETPNSFVFSVDGKFTRSFYAGDGIQTVQIDRKGKIWVGYFDEGVFGAFNPMPLRDHPSYNYGPNGLVRLDDQGAIEFAYNKQFPDKFVSDI